MKKIIVAGHISYDMTPRFENKEVQKISELIRPGSITHVGPVQSCCGGCVNNTGMALQKLGANPLLIAKIGKDAFGEAIREDIRSLGGNASFIVSEQSHTSYSVVIAAPGIDRAFLHSPGANDDFLPEDLHLISLKEYDFFHFGYPTLMRQFYLNGGQNLTEMFRHVKELGLISSMDVAGIDPDSEAGQQDWKQILTRTLPYVDIFVPSFEELLFMMDPDKYRQMKMENAERDLCENLSLKKDILPLAESVLALGTKVLLVKCGVAGMYLLCSDLCTPLGLPDSWNQTSLFQDSFIPDKIVSATGAGDTSIAAFLYGLLNRFSPKQSLQIAAATGASCLTAVDTYSGLLSIAELQKKIDNGWKTQKVVKE